METKTTKGAFYLFISTLVFVITGYISNIWLGRYLGPEDYGVYGLIAALMTIGNLFQNSGLPQSVSKYIAEHKDHADSILYRGLCLQLIIVAITTAVFLLFSGTIATHVLKDSLLKPYIQLSSLVFPFYGIYAFYLWYYNGLHRFKRQALMNITFSLSKLLLIIILTLFFKLTGTIMGFIFSPFIALLTGFKFPRKNNGLIFPYKKLILFSLPLTLFSLFSSILQSQDLFFLKMFHSEDALPGYYTANQNISRILFFSLSVFSLVLFPSISKSVSDKTDEKTKEIISRSLRLALLLLLPATLAISGSSKEIIRLLFSEKYVPGAASLSILIFSFSFLTIFSILANILNGAGYPKRSMVISFLSVLVSGIFCYFLIPPFGLVGAAVATGLGGFFAMSITGYFVFKKFGALLPIRSTINICAASLLLYGLVLIIKLPTAFLPLTYTIAGVCYLVTLRLLQELTHSDYNLVFSLIPAKFARRFKSNI